MYRVFLICTVFALSGCVFTGPTEQMEQQQEISECLNLGFAPDSPEFAECRMQVREANAARAAYAPESESILEPTNIEVNVRIGDDDNWHNDHDDHDEHADHEAHKEPPPPAQSETPKCKPNGIAGTICQVN